MPRLSVHHNTSTSTFDSDEKANSLIRLFEHFFETRPLTESIDWMLTTSLSGLPPAVYSPQGDSTRIHGCRTTSNLGPDKTNSYPRLCGEFTGRTDTYVIFTSLITNTSWTTLDGTTFAASGLIDH
ncbi:hypothetical protein QCA50_008837 [Cerrena zonata]|uniref:Uncharacterized protein n=1 Tax=Cerrena zonata TaxID=2478898 RepID=A0AAW0G1J9_9APHY